MHKTERKFRSKCASVNTFFTLLQIGIFKPRSADALLAKTGLKEACFRDKRHRLIFNPQKEFKNFDLCNAKDVYPVFS